MAVELATKYLKGVVDLFNAKSLIAGTASTDYDFSDAETIYASTPVYGALVPFTRSGANRYGIPAEVGSTKQAMKVTQDYGISQSLDKGNVAQNGLMLTAGKVLADITKLLIVPKSDTYVINAWARAAGTVAALATPVKTTIVGMLFDAETAMDNASVDAADRYVLMRPDMYALVRQAPEFIATESLAQDAIKKGVLGTIGTLQLKKGISNRMPTNLFFLAYAKRAVIYPVQLNDGTIYDKTQGYRGPVIEASIVYDGFVLDALCYGVYAGVATANALPVVTNTGALVLAFTLTCAASTSIKYTLDGTDPHISDTALSCTSGTPVTATAGAKLVIAYGVDSAAAKFNGAVTTLAFTVTAS
jgi:hypothetical protein